MEKPFDRILVVMFENQYRSYVIQDPFFKKLASAGADMTNYFGAFHPSQTNYLASLAGEVCAATNDTPPASPLMQQTLVDLLEPAGVSWKAYMEAYPGDPWNPVWQDPNYPASDQPLNESPDSGPNLARYFRKHNAFASFHSIQKDEDRWNRIVSETEFWEDALGGNLPEYSWFTPDIWNDGHYLYNTHIDTNPRTELVPQVSGWLEYVFLGNIAANKVQGGAATGEGNLGFNLDIDLLLTNPEAAWKQSHVPEGTLIVITFDEADYDAEGYDTNYDGPNQVYTVLLGDMIPPGTIGEMPYNHYSLIKTVEKNYGLGDLGKNDRDANWFRFLWDEKFGWSAPIETGLETGGSIAAAYLDDQAFLVCEDGDENLNFSRLDGSDWSELMPTGLTGQGPLALAAIDDTLRLIFSSSDGRLSQSTFTNANGWTESEPMDGVTAGDIAMTAYHDDADGTRKLMLCWRTGNGFMKFRVFENGAWQSDVGDVGQLTDGPMALGQMGPSLYLVYKERNTRKMRITSFNTGPFNAFEGMTFNDTPDPENGTTLHQWSPFDRPVGHFAGKMAALQNDYQALGNLTMATIDGEMHLVHRGAYKDKPHAFTEVFGLTGILTAENQLTNGNGTLKQAGWTLESRMDAIQLDIGAGIAMASTGESLLLVWQQAGSQQLSFCTGGYHSIKS